MGLSSCGRGKGTPTEVGLVLILLLLADPHGSGALRFGKVLSTHAMGEGDRQTLRPYISSFHSQTQAAVATKQSGCICLRKLEEQEDPLGKV